MRQPSDPTEDLASTTSIVALLEHEGRHSEASKLAGFTGESIWVFLHGVANEHQGADPQQLCFFLCAGSRIFSIWVWPALHMICDMVLASCSELAIHLDSSALFQPAVEDQLELQPADSGGLTEHFSL